MYPELGKAGTPYARTVRAEVKGNGAKPDPGLLFDREFTNEEALAYSDAFSVDVERRTI